MTDTSAPSPAVLCPMCLGRVALDTSQLWEWSTAGADYRPLEIPDTATPEQRRHVLRRAQVRCPNQAGQRPNHYLPYHYVDQERDPVVVAMVGAPASGKTHLLASMVGTLQEKGTEELGISVSPLDVELYQAFTDTMVRPLLNGNKVLERTNTDVWEFVLGLVVRDLRAPADPGRAVVFFDVSGEDMSTHEQVTGHSFLGIVDGFLFVISPEDLENDRMDATVSAVLGAVEDRQDKAAVLVLGKADQLRFEQPVDRWLRESTLSLDPERLDAESRDVYAFIRRYGRGESYLRPWKEMGRSAIHVASATGSSRPTEDAPVYARPVRPQRALQPFLTLMHMTGVLPHRGKADS
ncbi:hypothetical protein ACOALZ_14270 [Nocardiopsis algeriensis]|uniref:hypothetical protein n=1 Tax=Nocardiopsis algeriensis TaxID=1478215 RepID=UPI003B43968D